jgi:hypothetical protein
MTASRARARPREASDTMPLADSNVAGLVRIRCGNISMAGLGSATSSLAVASCCQWATISEWWLPTANRCDQIL